MIWYWCKRIYQSCAVTIALMMALGITFKDVTAHPGVTDAAVIWVNTFQDELNSDGDCSLREAIRSANLNIGVDGCVPGNGYDTIYLGIGHFDLTIPGTGEDSSLTGDFDITENLRLYGSGANQTAIDGNDLDRVFHHVSGTEFKISRLTIQNGSAPVGETFSGGGILNKQGTLEVSYSVITSNTAANTGGGIDNVSIAILSNVTINDNTAVNGGGIFNDGTLYLTNSTLSGNTALDRGGGVDNYSDATFINVTFSSNSATANNGGALFNDGDIDILNSTISNNTTGINNAYVIRIKNSILANSTAGENCVGDSLTSRGYNLDDKTSCSFNGVDDYSNTPALLGTLQDNGGLVLTHALLAGSPAIDHADNLDCPATDGRGAIRPADGDGNSSLVCDRGAYEFNAKFPTVLLLPLIIR